MTFIQGMTQKKGKSTVRGEYLGEDFVDFFSFLYFNVTSNTINKRECQKRKKITLFFIIFFSTAKFRQPLSSRLGVKALMTVP